MKKAIYILAGLVIAGVLIAIAVNPRSSIRQVLELGRALPEGMELSELEPQSPGAISALQQSEHHWTLGTGWWFDEGRSILGTNRRGCARLSESFESIESLNVRFDCRGLVDLGGSAELLIVLVEEETAPACQLIVGLNRKGKELWRYAPQDETSAASAAPLRDEDGLYGVAFRLGYEGGIVALDLEGHLLWAKPSLDSPYDLLTHPAVPGRLVQLGGDANWFVHTAGNSDSGGSPGPSTESASNAGQNLDLLRPYLYAMDGVLFPDRQGKPRLFYVGGDIEGGEWIASEDQDGARAWSIHLSDIESSLDRRVSGIVTLGPSHGTTYFGLALEDGTLFVLDEDGALLDRIRIPDAEGNPDGGEIYDLTGGTLANGKHVLLAETLYGFSLFEVELP